MFETEERRELSIAVKSAIPEASKEPSAVICAYLTFLLREKGQTLSSEIPTFSQLEGPKFKELENLLLDFQVSDFMRYVCPLESLSPYKEFAKMKKRFKFQEEIDYLASIILIRNLITEKELLNSKESLRRVHAEYKKIMSKNNLHGPFVPADFYDFVNMLYSFELDGDATNPKRPFKSIEEKKKVYEAINNIIKPLFDDFRLSRVDVANVLVKLFRNCSNATSSSDVVSYLKRFLIEDLYTNPFSEVNRLEEPDVELQSLLRKIASAVFTINTNNCWYETLCAFHTSHRGNVDIAEGEIKKVSVLKERKNDVSLETSFLYNLFTSNARRFKSKFLCLLPSPFFIEKWMKDEPLRDCFVDFVVENQFYLDVMWRHINSILSLIAMTAEEIKEIQKHIRLIDFETFKKEMGRASSSYTDILINEPLLPKEDRKEMKNYIGQLNAQARICRVVDLCADVEMLDKDSIFFDMPNSSISSIFLIPQGTGGTAPSVKDIWVGDFGNNVSYDTCSIYFLKHKKDKKEKDENLRRIFLPNMEQPLEIGLNQYREIARPLREIFKTPKKFLCKKGNANENTFTYHFCNEIEFVYHRMPVKGSTCERYNYYVCFYSYENQSSGKKRKKMGVVYKPNNQTQEYFENWIEKKYLDQKAPKGDGKNIRELIALTIGPTYKKATITLRAFWVFYSNLKELLNLSNRDEKILRESVINRTLGNMYLSEITEEDIRTFYNSSEKESLNVVYDVVLSLFSKIFDFAVKQGNCLFNPLSNVEEENSSMQKLRNALVKKTFTSDEFRILYQSVKVGAANENRADLCILLRLLTGLSTSEVRALKWSDLVEIKEYKGSLIRVLQVYKQMSIDGTIQYLNPEDRIRLIPLGKDLGELLASLKPLNSQGFIASDKSGALLKDRAIAERLKKHISKLNIKDITISIPSDSKGYTERLLTNYGGDILRANFRFWAFKEAAFTRDEVNAILGIQRQTVLGVHYIDFRNEQTLVYLGTKQSRLEAFVKKSPLDKPSLTEIKKIPSVIREMENESWHPLQMEIRMLPGYEEKLTIGIESKLGLKVSRFNLISQETK